jgi:DNA polymerase III subunit delta'
VNLSLQLLRKAALENRLAHLLLFHGGSASERRSAGLHLAQTLNCYSPEKEGPCQKCQACKKVASGNHPDVEVIEPLKLSIGIEQVLKWQERVYRKHFEGNYKVFILEEADSLTIPAANALLKVIEEPPERTIIILSALNAEALLLTIQSRAQSVFFPVTGEEGWLAGLEESIDLNEAKEAFRLSSHSPELAYNLLEIGTKKVKEWIDNFYKAIYEQDFLKLFPLFPIERKEALVYLQVLALRAYQKTEPINPVEILAFGKAIDQIKVQANPRLAIEVLALELFRQGGNQRGRGRGGSL